MKKVLNPWGAKPTHGSFRLLQPLALMLAALWPVSSLAQPASEHVLNSLLLDIDRAEGSSRLVAVGDRGHVIWSDDMGHKWHQTRVPSEVMLTAVSFPSPSTGYAVGHDASIFKTVNGGESWSQVFEDKAAEVPLLDVFFVDEQAGFALGAYGYFVQTSDGGKTWHDWSLRTGNEDEMHLNAMTRLDDGTLIIAGEAGLLLRSVDNGNVWEALEAPYDGSFFGIEPFDGRNSAIAFGLRGNAYITRNSGESWSELETGTKQTLFDGVVMDGGVPLLVGGSGAIALKIEEDSLVSNLADRSTLTGVVQTRDDFYVVTGERGVRRVGPDFLGQSLSSR